jgi:hypothetical protein
MTADVWLIIVGIALIVHGVYEQRLRARALDGSIPTVKHVLVPRTYLDEQLPVEEDDGSKSTTSAALSSLFDNASSPWLERAATLPSATTFSKS